MLSSRGYGVLIDRDETSRFHLASDRRRHLEPRRRRPEPRLPRLRRADPGRGAERGSAPPPVASREAAAPWVYGPWFQTGQPNVIPLADEAAFIRTLRDGDAPVSAAETQMHYLPCGAQRNRADYIAARAEQFHRRRLRASRLLQPAALRLVLGGLRPGSRGRCPADRSRRPASRSAIRRSSAATAPPVSPRSRWRSSTSPRLAPRPSTRVWCARPTTPAMTAGWRTSASTPRRPPSRPTAPPARRCTTATRPTTTARCSGSPAGSSGR